MKTTYVNEKKLRDALRESNEAGEFINLIKMADIAERKIESRLCPNYYRINDRVFEFLFDDPQEVLASAAHQLIGFLNRIRKATGISALKIFIPEDQEIDAIREIMDILNCWTASKVG